MIDIQEIPPGKINYSSSNIRSVLDATGPLAESMETHGQLEPGTGWWEDEQFRIATGHRRANACRHLEIPFLARIIEPMNGPDLVEFQLVENIQAEALPPVDLERAVETLVKSYGNHHEVGKRIGKSPQWVSTIVGARSVRESLSDAADEKKRAEDPTKSMATSTAARFGQLKNEDNRKAAYEEALRRNEGDESLPGNLVKNVVEEFKENEIRDTQAYIWKLQQERVKLVRKRADIEAEIDRIDAKINRLSDR
jgi:ParB/RepB/Spo0J family partition protein